jgi:transcriptional regulator with XRE-family HTH domain
MDKQEQKDICQRVAQLRQEFAGKRGKAAFAKQLGLSPSTYDYYEASRPPPSDVLVRMAELANVDLRWLLSGKGEPRPATNHPAVARAAQLLAKSPSSAAALEAFVDLLEQQAAQFPIHAAQDSPAQPGPSVPPSQAARPPGPSQPPSTPPDLAAEPSTAGFIPVLGRSAAAVPQFWADPRQSAGLTQLGDLVRRHVRTAADIRRPASAWPPRSAGSSRQVALVSFNAPGQGGATEFVDAPGLKERFPDAFALRIDGHSMHPDIRHGDLVVLSPTAPAVDGKPAVIQLAGQIGVTCKLFRRQGRHVHLVAINEDLAPQVFPDGQVVWALRVLCRIRPS